MNDLSIINNKALMNRQFKSDIPEYLNKEEINLLLSNIKDSEKMDGLLIMFLWRTGVRITEAISIKKRDIDFINQTAKIRWLKKRKAIDRVIPLERDLIYNLSVYCSNLNLDDLIFPFTRQRAFQIIKKHIKRNLIQKVVSPHTFRHSFAINFLKQTKNLVALQKLLGHAQITTTMIYLNIVQSDLREELNKVEW
jgi:integrase